MKRHIISQPAIKDLENIVDYFSKNNLKAGEKFINGFEKKCQYLAQFPKMGRSYDDLKQSLRGLNFDKYIIFYRIIDDGIEIVRVVSCYRDLDSLFSTQKT